MVATEVGVQLVFDAQVLTPGRVTTLAGSTLSVVVLLIRSDGTTRRLVYPATIGAQATILGTAYGTASYGSYITNGTEFPTAGVYEVQLLASFNAGAQSYKSPPYVLNVDLAL